MKDNTVSIKGTLGDAAEPAPKNAAERAAAAVTATKRAYRDNVTGAIYEDEAQCVNGCATLVGEEAERAIATGAAPARSFGLPPTAAEQTAAELARLEKVDADTAEAAKTAAAKSAAPAAAASAAPTPAASAAPKGDEPATTKARKKSANK